MRLEVEVLDRHFGNSHIARTVTLSLSQWLRLKLFGHTPLEPKRKPEWRGDLMFHVVCCEEHGFFLDYPHGHRQYFSCPKCEKETKA